MNLSPLAWLIIYISVGSVLGIALGHIKYKGVGIGIGGVLFSGILVGHFAHAYNGFDLATETLAKTPAEEILHFLQEFGLMLFVYAIGIQVGPSFFAALKGNGIKLISLAISIIILGCCITLGLYFGGIVGPDAAVGMYSGAITNTPALSAAGMMVGELSKAGNEYSQSKSKGHDAPIDINVVVENSDYFGKTLKDIACIAEGTVVCSRIKRDGILSVPTKDMMLVSGDILHLVGGAKYVTKTASEIGTETKDVLTTHGSTLTVRHLVITKNNVMGRTLGELDLESHYGIVVSRVFRSGIQFMPDPNFRLAMGDEINVIGQLENVRKAARVVGNSATTMNKVPMLPIFVGLFLGMLLGSLELAIPGVPAPLKLGIIGGTLVVAILLARFGDAWSRNHIHWRLPQPAISSFKEFGITLFLTIVGIRAGASGFWDTLTNGDGLVWMAWATLISIIPLLIVGFIGYKIAKVNYLVLCGVLAGACTDPPALAYANGLHKDAEASSIGYATVYPFVMFLRILSPQIMLLIMSASFI